jgi:outer membrane protein OmpA-like peptidoglycan-associated protein
MYFGQPRSGFGQFGATISVAASGNSPACSAEERRIHPVVEPPASELVNVERRHGGPRQLHRDAYAAYQRLKAAAEADGIPANLLTMTSGYRSVASQQALWEAALQKYGSPQAARRWVAPPGGSPHHTGRAIDFNLGGRNNSENVAQLRQTAAYRWLVCNASRFGFFPYAAEPWHWEYNPPAGATSQADLEAIARRVATAAAATAAAAAGGLPAALAIRAVGNLKGYGFGQAPPRGTSCGLRGFGEPVVPAGPKPNLVFDKFEFGLSLVPAAHKPAIDALADQIVAIGRQVPGPLGTVRLVGHTDFIGREEYNRALGLMRAKAVRGALATALEARLRGVTSRIEIVPESRGVLQPVTTDKSAAGRERNRRVEVFVSLNSPPAYDIPGVTKPWPDYTGQDKPPPHPPKPPEIDEEVQKILNTKIPPLPRKCVNLYDWVVQKLRRLLNRLLQKTPIPRRFHARIQELAEKRARGLRDDLIERGLEEIRLEARFRPTARQLIVYAIQQVCI